MPSRDFPEPVRDAVIRFRDRFRLPAPLFLSVLELFNPLTPKKKVNELLRVIVTGIEDVTRRGSRRFTLRSVTLQLFAEFIQQHPDFPYRRNYETINFYQGAHTGGPRTGITFQDRIYLFERPHQTPLDMSVAFHEYVHTFQYKQFGLVSFIKLYVGDYAANVLTGSGTPYENIEFEREAFDWETRFRTWVEERYSNTTDNRRIRPLDPAAFA
jgi:hypothetical protein